jgi:nucleotide-binding universal stress UspA family protein
MNIERIVVGIDGSENSRRALAWSAELAESLDAEVIAVHSIGLLERLGEGHALSEGTYSDVRHEFDTSWCAALERSGLRSVRVLRDGNPVSVLLAVAEEFDADLIVVGSRGVGGYPELLLGSTSTQVAQHSTRPVTIVPASADESAVDA